MKRNLILASASPRRQELLKLCKVPFTVEVSKANEVIDRSLPLTEAIALVAKQKAEEVFSRNLESLVLGSDTIVAIGNEILGKPKDKEDARRMMHLLSGKTHQVITGVCLMCKEETRMFASVADVTFSEMSEAEIEDYISKEEPYDKAGAYALQGEAAIYISGITGDYYTIVGLPVHLVYKHLQELGY
ncbi:MAG: septum formation protein Maf [Erysipelotrichaceae bacterium]|nr:septum formation protein Maf [Erysipelotrichaceae bacterium]